MTFFAEGSDRVSYDALLQIRDRFDGIVDVVTHDAVALLKTYLVNLTRLIAIQLADMMEFPVNLLFATGLLLLALRRWNLLVVPFWLVALMQILLVNCKALIRRSP